jgi:hypothetical protein
MTVRALFLASVLGCAAAAVAEDRLAIVPERPVAGEPFVIEHLGESRQSLPYLKQRSTVTVNGLDVTLALDFSGPAVSAPKFPGPFDPPSKTYLAQQVAVVPAAGTYRLNRMLPGGQPEALAALLVDPPRAAATPQWTNLSGNFFAPDENGAGVNVIQGASGQVFAILFTYGFQSFVFSPPGSLPTTYVVSGGKWISPVEFRGVMYETYGTPIGVAPYDPARFSLHPVGLMTLRFSDRNAVDLDAQFTSGIRKQKRLGRQQF